MIRTMWDKILALFGKSKISDNSRQEENERYTLQYEDTRDINFTAIFANKLANYVISDSNIDVTGNNKRAELLQNVIKKLKKKVLHMIQCQVYHIQSGIVNII